ncbi:hypothetical protein [Enterovirga sp.]|jgi:hypothetical protein|uniref:hypothetical protein n=1 Tax=Enterovirga sp. TaxID=2026350 RepID=UPI00261426DB|nr:hypothetical protein [Enterovirga sp.]MDB5591019.1 hypothetical protein [Enterovirga sp.]
MATTQHTLDQLATLIGAAKREADRLGPAASEAARHLDAAARAVRTASAAAGPAQEGLRPEELNTTNDK